MALFLSFSNALSFSFLPPKQQQQHLFSSFPSKKSPSIVSLSISNHPNFSSNPTKHFTRFPLSTTNHFPKTLPTTITPTPPKILTLIHCQKPETDTDTDTETDTGTTNSINCIAMAPTTPQSTPLLPQKSIDCIGTGSDVECVTTIADPDPPIGPIAGLPDPDFVYGAWESVLLISPFFFWGTAMVAMKEVLPKAGPFFVSAFRLIPAGAVLIAFAAAMGRKQPSGVVAWLWILLFGAVDAACFQGFLAKGLQKTSAGLGSVIIDSQPLTVAILATLLFGESIGLVGAAGLVVGVIGLLLLEVPSLYFDEGNTTLWGSGEWWMLLAAQSMAVGTVMVRYVSKFSDPIMATGWHMVIGGIPLLALSVLNHDPAISGSFKEFTSSDILALIYTSLFGSAISYGVYFYNATRGSLTKLSSLTFLTPMFASIFGFIYLGETFSPLQLVGAAVTVVAIYMVNYQSITDKA